MMADGFPERDALPRYVAPLPARLEDFALRYAWLVVAINLAGTAFGFWYYRFQFADTSMMMWPWVPDSPLATLFMACSLALWKLGRSNEVVNVLAFVGNIKLGLWTPFTLLVFYEEFSYLHWAMFSFLFCSHLAMVAQAFLIHRYSTFPVWAVAATFAWYTFDLVVDYFVPIVGGPHHTAIPADPNMELWLGAAAIDVAAAGAVVLTIWIAIFALTTRVKKLEGSTLNGQSTR